MHEELAAAVAAGEVASRAATIITGRAGPGQARRRRRDRGPDGTRPDPHGRRERRRLPRPGRPELDRRAGPGRRRALRRAAAPTPGRLHPRPRHGLHHLEIFATTEQFEHLLTVMNTATNPRTTTPGHLRHRDAAADPEPAPPRSPPAPTADQPVPAEDPGRLDLRTRPQKRLDGLVGGCKAALAAGAVPAAGGLRPQVMVTIDYRDLLARLGTGMTGTTRRPHGPAPPPASTSAGVPGTGRPGTPSRPARCSSPDPSPPPPSGRSPATPTSSPSCSAAKDGSWTSAGPPGSSRPTMRKALTARDQGCAFPGCTIPAPWCEAHHITYWSRGGTTGTDNGALLCSHHHHLIHKEHWTIQSRTGVPWFIPPPHIDPRQRPTTQPLLPPRPTPQGRVRGGRGPAPARMPGPAPAPHGVGQRPGTRGVRRFQELGKTLC